MDETKVREAALSLDVDNDAHWTAQGEAKLDTLRFKLGVSLTRDELDRIMPGFNRESLRRHLASLPSPEASNGRGEVAEVPVQSEQPKVEEPIQGEASFESLSAEVDRAYEEVQRLERIQEEVRLELDKARNTYDVAERALRERSPTPSSTHTIQNYLRQQVINTQRRGEARAALSTAGVSLKALNEITAASKLDQAFARRRPRPIGG